MNSSVIFWPEFSGSWNPLRLCWQHHLWASFVPWLQGQFHVRPQEYMNASHQDGLTHISVWSEPHWNSLWYRWSGCPAALLCLQKQYKEVAVNITNETKAAHGYKTLREKLAFMNQTQSRPIWWERKLSGTDNYTVFVFFKMTLLMWFITLCISVQIVTHYFITIEIKCACCYHLKLCHSCSLLFQALNAHHWFFF